MVDLSRSRRKPYAHQLVGVERMTPLVEPERGRTYPGCFLLADEMRLGKTKQIIDTAQVLFEQKEITTAIVITPAPVRDVWLDPELGEIAKHRWEGFPTFVQEYHSRKKEWVADYDAGKPFLRWVVSNYEYIRHKVKRGSKGWSGPYLEPLLRASQKTLLVLDESSYVSNPTSLQARACAALRARCSRVIELNGTPYGENAEDLYGQFKMLDWRILGFPYITQFRARYAVMGGYQVERVLPNGKKIKVAVEVVGWRHAKRPDCCDVPPHVNSPVHAPGPGLEEIRAKVAPYILRRVRSECMDLPPKLEPVTLTAVLTPETWKLYKEMRDHTVAWLDQQSVAISVQAGVAVMRLAQITSGFLGGIKDMEAQCPECGGSGIARPPALTLDAVITSEARRVLSVAPELGAPGEVLSGVNLEPEECFACGGEGTLPLPVPPREMGREKLDLFLGWVRQRLEADHEMRMIHWCRFQPELHRVVRELKLKFPQVTVGAMYGGQKVEQRHEALRLMHPDVKYSGPAILNGTLGTGGLGLNMCGADQVVYSSQDYSLLKRLQSEDRPIGADQRGPVSYHDILAVGPNGQKTVDHIIAKDQRTKHDLARWTTSAWVEALARE